LHTLANLHPATHGTVFLHDRPITALKPKMIARQLGILFQDTLSAFSQTVLEFCLTGRHPYRSVFHFDTAADHALALQSLRLLELDTQLTQSVQTLSGGERRRLAIATLLTQAPAIYLLDEPLNHLDIRHQMRVLQHFQQLARTGASVMLTLHDVTLAAALCHQILLVFGGGSTLYGTPEKILTTDNLSRLYGHPLQSFSLGTRQVWLPALAI
jgi:iron complex transport system ATP-binding protein